MDIRNLEYIIAITEEKSLSKAARRVFISQPALSQYLAKLESELDTKLFERDGITMSLTDSGKVYVNGARIILDLKKSAMIELEEIKTRNHSTLIIGSNEMLKRYVRVDLITSLKKELNSFSFDVKTMKETDAIASLTDGTIDYAVLPEINPLELPKQVQCMPLFEDKMVLIAKDGLSPSNLPMIHFTNNSTLSSTQVRLHQEYHPSSHVKYETDDLHTLLGIVQKGEAYALLPESMLNKQENGLHLTDLIGNETAVNLYYCSTSKSLNEIRARLGDGS